MQEVSGYSVNDSGNVFMVISWNSTLVSEHYSEANDTTVLYKTKAHLDCSC